MQDYSSGNPHSFDAISTLFFGSSTWSNDTMMSLIGNEGVHLVSADRCQISSDLVQFIKCGLFFLLLAMVVHFFDRFSFAQSPPSCDIAGRK